MHILSGWWELGETVRGLRSADWVLAHVGRLECSAKRCRAHDENDVDASSFYYIADDRV